MKNKSSIPENPLSVTLSLEEYQRLLDRVCRSEETDIKITQLQQENERLRWKLLLLQRLCWGRSSEKRRLPETPGQLSICFDTPTQVDVKQVEQEVKKEEQEATRYNRFRKKYRHKEQSSHSRQPIAGHLPREKKVLEPSVDLTGAVRLGEEITERYALQPRRLYVEQLIRPRYKLTDGRIVIAPMPETAHPRSNASESILAHIAVAKYADHLPLNRQIDIFTREGVTLAPSTISNWMMAAGQCIEPIYNELREQMKKTRYVQADETPCPVLETERPGKLHKGYMWAFYLPQIKSPYFEYHQGRGGSALGTLLSGQTQIVQSDGFSAYDIFDKLPDKLHLCCWAHVRRKFVEAELYDPPAAGYAIEQIGQLYAVEKDIREKQLTADEAVALRQKEAYPVIQRLEVWVTENLSSTPKDSPLEKAMQYMYRRFEQLSHYVNDAELSIDNNAVERTIRPLTLNRKNCLFSGSHDAAHTAAIFFSLFGACRENKVNPYNWLKDVLIKVKTADPKDYTQLLPNNWKE